MNLSGTPTHSSHTGRNGFIDIQKFLYSWIIVFLHFYIYTREHFKGGGSSVEFFLIASGAFFYAGYQRKTATMEVEKKLNYPTEYIKKRLLRFLPYTIPAFIPAFVVSAVINDNVTGVNGLTSIIDEFVRNMWELPLLSMCGLNGGAAMLNGPTWTLSAMLIVEFLILHLLVRYEKSFLSFFAPIMMLAGLGLWANLDDVDHMLWRGFTNFGVIRTFIMTCLGIYAWRAAQRLSEISMTSRGRLFLTFVELSCHAIAIGSMMYRNTRYYRLFCALLFVIAITITLSRQSYTATLFSGKNAVTSFLGEWSMSIYITHIPIRNLMYRLFDSPYEFYRTKYVYGAIVIVVSLVFLYLGRWVTKSVPVFSKKLRSAFIEHEIDPTNKQI